jgi:acyl-CoA synthetase (AMP-forming)/AMP-acid ligase II
MPDVLLFEHGTVTVTTMLRMLAGEASRRHGGREAFVAGDRRLTFAELDRLSDAVAAGLAHRGVLPGDVVAIALPPVPEYAVCALAVAKLAAIAAGYDLTLPPDSLAALHDVVQPCLTVAAPGVRLSGELVTVDSDEGGRGGRHGLGGLGPAGRLGMGAFRRGAAPGSDAERTLAGLVRKEPPPPPMPPDPYRPVVIVTSGSAESPRGAIFGDRQLDAIRRAEAGVRWGGGDPRLLGPGYPEFLSRLPCVLQTGTTVHALRHAGEGPHGDVEDELRATAELSLPTLTGTSERLTAVLSHPMLPRLEFPELREIVVTGTAPGPELVQALRERFGVPVRTLYLPVEAGLGLDTRRGGPEEDVETTVGRPVPGVTLAIRGSDGRPVGAGATGQVLLRSDAVMSGYWNDPASTARTITKDGFVRTGDLGWVDEEGRLHLADADAEPSSPS